MFDKTSGENNQNGILECVIGYELQIFVPIRQHHNFTNSLFVDLDVNPEFTLHNVHMSLGTSVPNSNIICFDQTSSSVDITASVSPICSIQLGNHERKYQPYVPTLCTNLMYQPYVPTLCTSLMYQPFVTISNLYCEIPSAISYKSFE